jgi:hypothetical protein
MTMMIALVRAFERTALSFIIITVGLLAVAAEHRLSSLESWIIALCVFGYIFAGLVADIMEYW